MTISKLNISSYGLMERAVFQLFGKMADRISWRFGDVQFIVVAGTGNNGGDGLGVARLLMEKKARVEVWLCDFSSKMTPECKMNLDLLLEKDSSCVISLKDKGVPAKDFGHNTILIDSIFGTGLSRCVDGDYANVISSINELGVEVWSIDIPSGVFGEDNKNNYGPKVKADVTFTIQDYPLSAMCPESAAYFGDVCIVDIGHCEECVDGFDVDYKYLEESDVIRLIRTRNAFDHKGSFGHAMLIAGSEGKAGAAIMSARACMRSGVGLLTVHLPRNISNVMHVSVPEAMVDLDVDNCLQTKCNDFDKYTSLGIGPGIGTGRATLDVVKQVLAADKPTVLDADALNIISSNGLLSGVKDSILTPHPKEFERLFGKFGLHMEKLNLMSSFSRENNCVVVLKGGVTAISLTSGEVVFYVGRNPGMATGGSGDVLTGIITALVAQGYSLDDAAVIGVWVHGEAGRLASEKNGVVSMIASDIIENIPLVFKRLYELHNSYKSFKFVVKN